MSDPIVEPVRRSHARSGFLLAALLVAVALAWLRPLVASSAAEPQDPPKPGAAGGKEEENGGDLVFQVISKTQKYSVLYSHDLHLGKGIECAECHEKVFKKKINGNKFKMADINRGQFCGTCHTETPAADVKHAAFAPKKNCSKCHTMRVREPDSK